LFSSKIALNYLSADTGEAQSIVLQQMGDDGLIPLSVALKALDISPGTARKLRESGKLRPVTNRAGKNTKLYVTVKNLRALSRQMLKAPAPSKRRSYSTSGRKSTNESS